MSLSIIIPTKGRDSLAASLMSVVRQLHDGDEVIVVADGHIEHVQELCSLFEDVRYFHTAKVTCDSGASQRDLGIMNARGAHLMFLDDDDIYVTGALRDVRHKVADDFPQTVHIFRMVYGEASQSPGLVLWGKPEIALCNIGTPMLVVRNHPGLPRWVGLDDKYHDFYWASALSVGRPVEFHPEILAMVRPSPTNLLREGLDL